MMHEHNDCQHEFKYCRICDVIYCEKCQKEWRYYIPSINSWSVTTTPLKAGVHYATDHDTNNTHEG